MGMMNLTKNDIEGLSALQTRMAIILLHINGIESAKQFILNVKKGKMPDKKIEEALEL